MAHLAHYREAHPLPFVFTHWINLFCMVCLAFTGFYIHYPFFPGFMGIARGLHIFCAFVIILNLIFRVVGAFFFKSATTGGSRKTDFDWKNFAPQKDNRHQLGAWLKYYLFAKKNHPLAAKFGVLQKISYLAIPVLLIIVAFTGFCIWAPTSAVGPFGAFNSLVGGVVVTRIAHYFMMWVFILFTMIHGYLALIEGLAPAKLMFCRQEHGGLVYDPEVHNIVGQDDLHES